MGRHVDNAIAKVMAKGFSKDAAIRILKKQGTIKQRGRHLVWAGKKENA